MVAGGYGKPSEGRATLDLLARRRLELAARDEIKTLAANPGPFGTSAVFAVGGDAMDSTIVQGALAVLALDGTIRKLDRAVWIGAPHPDPPPGVVKALAVVERRAARERRIGRTMAKYGELPRQNCAVCDTPVERELTRFRHKGVLCGKPECKREFSRRTSLARGERQRAAHAAKVHQRWGPVLRCGICSDPITRPLETIRLRRRTLLCDKPECRNEVLRRAMVARTEAQRKAKQSVADALRADLDGRPR